MQQDANGNSGPSNSVGQPLSTEELTVTLADKVAESVQTQLDAKLERMESRQRNRSVAGEWKAPIAELADELKLSEAQLGTATEQMERLSSLNVAVLEVETGYDPVADYIKTALQQ